MACLFALYLHQRFLLQICSSFCDRVLEHVCGDVVLACRPVSIVGDCRILLKLAYAMQRPCGEEGDSRLCSHRWIAVITCPTDDLALSSERSVRARTFYCTVSCLRYNLQRATSDGPLSGSVRYSVIHSISRSPKAIQRQEDSSAHSARDDATAVQPDVCWKRLDFAPGWLG